MVNGNGAHPAGIALEIADVTACRGTTVVLEGLSLSLPPEGAIGIVGGNGVGKTTLLDVISGLVRIESGSVRFDGEDAARWSPQERFRSGVRRTFQESHLYQQLTVGEVVRVAGSGPASGVAGLGRGGETIYVSELSTGQRRLLDLSAATSGTARLLLLDEPTAGIAPHERARLLDVIRSWRARTKGTLIVVEHDSDALERIVDDVIVLGDEPRPSHPVNGVELNGSRSAATVEPTPPVLATLDQLALTRRAAPRATPQGPSVWALARFGLREFAAGMLSVLTLGVLNRVMKVDLGIPLLVVAPVLAAYNLAAPLALWIGARSDRVPFRGLHRTPYIVGGSIVMGVTAALAPLVAWRLAANVGVVSVVSALVVFALMGAGMYGSGATYFALLSEVVSVGRERAVAVIYSMLMAGILAGVALSAYVLPTYEPQALLSLHGLVAVLIVVCTWWAVRGAEGRDAPIASAPTVALRTFVASAQVKRFFAFMVGLTFFVFLQQAILEPYGGDVFGLSVRATTSFNAFQIVAVLLGMIVAARTVVPRIGRRATTAFGSTIAALGLALLAVSGIRGSHLLLYAGIVGMGLGLGLLNVGSLSLMLDMTAGHAAGMAMGLWTVAHALADGAATATGGVLQAVALRFLGSDAPAYAAVFAFEAVGLIAVLALLRHVDPPRFKHEFETASSTERETR